MIEKKIASVKLKAQIWYIWLDCKWKHCSADRLPSSVEVEGLEKCYGHCMKKTQPLCCDTSLDFASLCIRVW